MKDIKKGILLIAEPFLKDPQFRRSVVLICQHQEAGTFGISINKILPQDLSVFMHDVDDCNIPVYDGGPVSKNEIHFLHIYPSLIPGGVHIINGIYWGGDFNMATKLLKNGKINDHGIRFYLGYAGWGEFQLEQEMKEKSWLTVVGTKELVFHQEAKEIWAKAVKELGNDFLPIIHYPIDPSLN
jgi:putative transcriptional regulator